MMNRRPYFLLFGLALVAIAAAVTYVGCGPSNPSGNSFRITGMCTWSCISNCSPFNQDDALGTSSCVDKCIFYEVDGTAREIMDTEYYVIAHNYLEPEPDDRSPNSNPSLGNLVVQKVQNIYRIQGTNIALPTEEQYVTLEIDAGKTGFIQNNLLGPQQFAALKSSSSKLPPFPFDVDVTTTLFARYAGSEYRATGSVTVTLTGIETLAEPTPAELL